MASTIPEPSLADIEAMLARTLKRADAMERTGRRLLAEAAAMREVARRAEAATGVALLGASLPRGTRRGHLSLALPPAG